MLNDLVDIANRYANGLIRIQSRKDQWIKKMPELKEHLILIADKLNSSTAYKQGFFVDTLHAFNEEIHGSCTEIQSLVFRSGDMPLHIAFTNEKGEKKELTEHGFQVTFSPAVTGEIFVFLVPHTSELNRTEPQVAPIGIYSEPSEITLETVDDLVKKGMEAAFYTSFTGITDKQDEAIEAATETTRLNIPRHNPIGFKRYETTQKAN